MIYLDRLNFLRAPHGPGPRDNYPAYPPPPLSTVLNILQYCWLNSIYSVYSHYNVNTIKNINSVFVDLNFTARKEMLVRLLWSIWFENIQEVQQQVYLIGLFNTIFTDLHSISTYGVIPQVFTTAWCPYNRYDRWDRYDSSRKVNSAIRTIVWKSCAQRS